MVITELSANQLSQAIHAKQVSCREVMQAYLQRIDMVNPHFNALVSLQDPATLLAQAHACDAELAQGHSRGWLHGLPIALKDLVDVAGIPTTCGSVLLRDNIPAHDALLVQRMKAAGGIVIGKTNTPEWGLGSHTFNPVFGATPNAFNPAFTAGGSSGGAAVALAQRMLPVADGSDFMGSLRNPAGWNHIFGMRPSQGRVPFGPGADVWVDQLGTEGPMARSVRDLARLLATQSGHDARQPLSINGSVDVSLNLTAGSAGASCTAGMPATTGSGRSYLQGAWCSTSYVNDPTARATFGVYRNADQFIYQRENY